MNGDLDPTGNTAGEDLVVQRLQECCYATVLPGVEVGQHDNFFDLGGDSLQLIKMVMIAQDMFDVELDAVEFFTDPTLDTLATAIRGELAAV